MLMAATPPDRISIAILALGGQGGGVLAGWIEHVATKAGWLAQGTSVPGVAQRTGSTVYYVELARSGIDGRLPVMAQMPLPGDVDIVIASELMETGRAMLRGFVSAERTTLIGSTSRTYAISEKSAMGDGRGNGERIVEAAQQRARRFVGFDMEAATGRSGSVISAVMFGALAGSDALPFSRESFEDAIRDSGIAVDSNLKGFAEGFDAACKPVAMSDRAEHVVPEPSTPAGETLALRARGSLPEASHANVMHGLKRLMDYQDARYAGLYLDRLETLAALDSAPFELTSEAARHLALWMSFEDTIRVADLKTRTSRMARVRDEVHVKQNQILTLTEFMHPRWQEVCETMPEKLGRWALNSPALKRLFAPLFRSGRTVETTSLRWFLMLHLLAGMRASRPRSLRYAEEQKRIEDWLALVASAARVDPESALELVRCQRLIKGYGDTFERGLNNFRKVIAAYLAQTDMPAATIARLREAALAKDSGDPVGETLAAIG